MAETPSQPPTHTVLETDSLQYWCYQCDKRVSIETLANISDVVCNECKSGFVEAIAANSHPTVDSHSGSSNPVDDPNLGSQFLQVLRLIAEAARDDDTPPPPPTHNPSSEDDFLRVELDGWDNDQEEDDDANDDDDDDDDYRTVDEVENEEGDRSDEENDVSHEEQEEERRRRRREDIRLRIRDFASRSRTGRNRILDWAEILMGLEDNSIEFRLEVPESDRFIGNPEDYVDAAGYETLLQTLAESDGSGRRGAPPAAKSAVMKLLTVNIASEDGTLLCAICKDTVNVGETAKKLPCGHGYHGDCIVPWLGSRNSCPVCRFELPTDDPDYEAERKSRAVNASDGASGSGGSNSVSG